MRPTALTMTVQSSGVFEYQNLCKNKGERDRNISGETDAEKELTLLRLLIKTLFLIQVYILTQ